nr:MAG TPA: hypothetical protein [Caudoviricetes sp.]
MLLIYHAFILPSTCLFVNKKVRKKTKMLINTHFRDIIYLKKK